jgi:acylphosphatase
MTKRVRLTVSGVVQGVGFRMYAQREARHLGLTGFVRNLPGGEVEIVAEGDATAVDRLVAWAHQGPPAARVERVEVEPGEPAGDFDGFDVRH